MQISRRKAVHISDQKFAMNAQNVDELLVPFTNTELVERAYSCYACNENKYWKKVTYSMLPFQYSKCNTTALRI